MRPESCRACARRIRLSGAVLSFADAGARADAASSNAAFDFGATLRGESNFFRVYYDDALGPTDGGYVADGVLAQCDADYSAIFDIFENVTPPLPMTCVLVTFDEFAGAYHHSCIDPTIYACGQTVIAPHAPDVSTALALLVAEEVEVFSAAQGLGWNCGDTNGEGLSRVLAYDLYPDVLPSREVNRWLDSGRPDYVAHNVGNDGDALSNGCAVTFLFFLRYVLGYDWSAIVAAGGATLEQTYQNLTGSSGGYTELRRCVDALYPPGSAAAVTTNNPFPVFDYYGAIGTIF